MCYCLVTTRHGRGHQAGAAGSAGRPDHEGPREARRTPLLPGKIFFIVLPFRRKGDT